MIKSWAIYVKKIVYKAVFFFQGDSFKTNNALDYVDFSNGLLQ